MKECLFCTADLIDKKHQHICVTCREAYTLRQIAHKRVELGLCRVCWRKKLKDRNVCLKCFEGYKIRSENKKIANQIERDFLMSKQENLRSVTKMGNGIAKLNVKWRSHLDFADEIYHPQNH